MKIRIACILFVLFYVFSALADDNVKSSSEKFDFAVKSYSSKDFVTAYNTFSELLSSDKDNFEINFNLGSCCFKMGKLGEARFYFERALLQKPFDADLYHNLEVIYDKIYGSSDVALQDIHSRRVLFAINKTVLIPLLLLCIFFTVIMFVLFYMTHGKRVFGIITLMFFLMSVIFFIYFGIQRVEFNRNVYVVKIQQTDVYLSPSEPDSVLMSLSEGAKGTVIEKTGSFIKIRMPDGTSGYIKRNSVISSDEI